MFISAHHVVYVLLTYFTSEGYCISLMATHYVDALMLRLYISSLTFSAIHSYGLVDQCRFS